MARGRRGAEDEEEDAALNAAAGEGEEEAPGLEDPDFRTESEGEEEEAPDGKGVLMSPQKRAVAKEERARLRLLRKAREEQLRVQEEMNREAAKEEGRRGAIRMQYLLAQADIFQHFMPEKKGPGLGGKRGSRRDLAKG